MSCATLLLRMGRSITSQNLLNMEASMDKIHVQCIEQVLPTAAIWDFLGH